MDREVLLMGDLGDLWSTADTVASDLPGGLGLAYDASKALLGDSSASAATTPVSTSQTSDQTATADATADIQQRIADAQATALAAANPGMTPSKALATVKQAQAAQQTTTPTLDLSPGAAASGHVVTLSASTPKTSSSGGGAGTLLALSGLAGIAWWIAKRKHFL